MTTMTLPTATLTAPTTSASPTTTAIAAALTAELATLPTCQETIHEVCQIIAAALRLADRQRAAGRAARRVLRLAATGVTLLTRLARETRDGAGELARVIRQVATAAAATPATAEDGEVLAALTTRLVAQRALERLREFATAVIRRPAPPTPARATAPMSAANFTPAAAPASATSPTPKPLTQRAALLRQQVEREARRAASDKHHPA